MPYALQKYILARILCYLEARSYRNGSYHHVHCTSTSMNSPGSVSFNVAASVEVQAKVFYSRSDVAVWCADALFWLLREGSRECEFHFRFALRSATDKEGILRACSRTTPARTNLPKSQWVEANRICKRNPVQCYVRNLLQLLGSFDSTSLRRINNTDPSTSPTPQNFAPVSEQGLSRLFVRLSKWLIELYCTTPISSSLIQSTSRVVFISMWLLPTFLN
jgi:hypothetical protein